MDDNTEINIESQKPTTSEDHEEPANPDILTEGVDVPPEPKADQENCESSEPCQTSSEPQSETPVEECELPPSIDNTFEEKMEIDGVTEDKNETVNDSIVETEKPQETVDNESEQTLGTATEEIEAIQENGKFVLHSLQ